MKNFNPKGKFHYTVDGNKKEVDGIPNNAYVLAGFREGSDKGLVTVHVNGKRGSALVPLLDDNGEQLRAPYYLAGRIFKDGEWT